jgi:hypothetical protein
MLLGLKLFHSSLAGAEACPTKPKALAAPVAVVETGCAVDIRYPLGRRPYIARMRAAIQGLWDLRRDDRIYVFVIDSKSQRAWDLDPDFDSEKPFICDRPGIGTI